MIHNDENVIPLVNISPLRLGTDGKGIRTLLAVYGCHLRCKYCLNPTSWVSSHSPRYYSQKMLYDIIKKHDLYYNATDGGITFGGGEPALYSDFIYDFVRGYCKNWNIAMETSLNYQNENIRKLVEITDYFYVDIKSLNEKTYYDYTGVSMDYVIENLQYLSEVCPHKVTVRIPLIPNYNDEIEQCETAEVIKKMGFSINIFKYTTLVREN